MDDTFILRIKKSFLWVFATISFVLIIIGGVRIIDLGLKSFIFTKADDQNCIYLEHPAPVMPGMEGAVKVDPEAELQRCKENQASSKQREASGAVAFLLVGSPLFWFFYKEARA